MKKFFIPGCNVRRRLSLYFLSTAFTTRYGYRFEGEDRKLMSGKGGFLEILENFRPALTLINHLRNNHGRIFHK